MNEDEEKLFMELFALCNKAVNTCLVKGLDDEYRRMSDELQSVSTKFRKMHYPDFKG